MATPTPTQTTAPTVGFPRSPGGGADGSAGRGPQPSGQPPYPSYGPTPIPKRPKGRLFLSVIFLGVIAYGGYHVWNSFFRYQAYGLIVGQTVDVSADKDGVIQYSHVRDGEHVKQGQVLVSMDDIDMRQQLARLTNEAQETQAALSAELAKLKWDYTLHVEDNRGLIPSYFEALGNLLKEEAALERMNLELEHRTRSRQLGGSSQLEYDQIRLDKQGQEKMVQHWRTMVDELRERVALTNQMSGKTNTTQPYSGLTAAGQDMIKPLLAKLDTLNAEKERIHERLERCQVTAPRNGVVVKFLRHPGERVKAGEAILTLLQDNSLEVCLYVPQEVIHNMEVGKDLELQYQPDPPVIECKITRLGDAFDEAPAQIERHYFFHQKLLPVFCALPENVPTAKFHHHAVVKLAR